MKVRELMIGDLVEYQDKHWHVLELLESNSSFPMLLGEEGLWEACGENGTRLLNRADILNVHPIPLDSEILKANGISLEEVGDNGPATPAIYRNRYEKWLIHTKWQDSLLWFDRRTKKWNLGNMNAAQFVYVHELQHAMRLVGLTEMADGFKL